MEQLYKILIITLWITAVCTNHLVAQVSISNDSFNLTFNKAGVTYLNYTGNSSNVNFIADGRTLGNVMVNYRFNEGEWNGINTGEESGSFNMQKDSGFAEADQFISYALGSDKTHQLIFNSHFSLKDDELVWKLQFQNKSEQPVELGDLALPLPLKTDYVGNSEQSTYEKRLVMHRFVSGHGSFIYWAPASGEGPYLVMTPVGETKLEYFDTTYEAYVHSLVSGNSIKKGSWRQPHTSKVLEPNGTSKDRVTYGFKFRWARSIRGVRDILYQNAGFDINIVPGMVIPNDLSAKFSIRTKNKIDSIRAEYPNKTRIDKLGKKGRNTNLYQSSFSELGENLLTVHYSGGRYMVLDFFVTEPLETLIKKRGSFIANKQQHRDKSKWYDGLYSLWDMKNKVLRSPENTGGLQNYMIGGSDDPSNSKPAYLSEKNVVFPDENEIESLEYHLKNFVWGGLQRTDKETPHPYGIYGSENWSVNREYEWGTTDSSRIEWYQERYGSPTCTGLGRERLWRSFDYTTYIMVYYNMYRISKLYPAMTDYLDSSGYLKRAFGTAKAFFEVPYSIYMPGPPLWSHKGYWDAAYKQGNFHEKYIIDLIDALREEGWDTEAEWLEKEWRKKVKYFIYDEPYPFGSEMSFDRTAFESTHAIAKYALESSLQPKDSLWFDKNLNKWYSHSTISSEKTMQFMERQINANVSLRGWLETMYYYLGSARVKSTYVLDYMSQMGGWSILDYALGYSKNPDSHLRLGYASLLSSWALMNTGTVESNYGYWYPGKKNDGAAGWGFKPEKYGQTWIQKKTGRGAWFYDGEIDHGLAGYVKAATTVIVDDSLFGWTAYGGTLKQEKENLLVIPRDGVRQKLSVITQGTKVYLELNRDNFAREKPVTIDKNLSYIKFNLENRTHKKYKTVISLSGLPSGFFEVTVNGDLHSKIDSPDKIILNSGDGAEYSVTIEKVK